jgi:hypothetical protein
MPTKTRLTREERWERIRSLSEKYGQFRNSLEPARIAEYEARFDHYSPRNALLIVMQRPEATVVRGFHDWKTYGRKVSKGAKGIQILAPAGTRVTQVDENGDPSEIARFFRITYVFDIADTQPLDEYEAQASPVDYSRLDEDAEGNLVEFDDNDLLVQA